MKPKICASLITGDPETAKRVEPLIDLFEVRIDLIIAGWPALVERFQKPWIACNRSRLEGGKGNIDEHKRIEELIQSLDLGAAIIDIELRTEKLAEIVPVIKKQATCLISYHDHERTPHLDEMKGIVRSQLRAGADICKVVTMAHSFEDNLTVLQLIREFPGTKLVAFCMGDSGVLSRVLSPLVGGEFTYASVKKGRHAAPGQMTVDELTRLYRIMQGT